jgi:N-acyl-D-amino-acid deacylase
MPYDLLIKNGRIIDGSGRPAFHGDVGVAQGKIVELGRLGGSARRVIEADGRVVSPGFVDNHCHYDAQVLWDPLCTFSCHHGATSVIDQPWSPVRGHIHGALDGDPRWTRDASRVEARSSAGA